MELNYIRSMKSIQGKLSLRTISTGSKSDGFRTYLTTEDGTEYQLYRKGVYEINDEYFQSFELKNVFVFGEIQNKRGKNWISVEYIKIK